MEGAGKRSCKQKKRLELDKILPKNRLKSLQNKSPSKFTDKNKTKEEESFSFWKRRRTLAKTKIAFEHNTHTLFIFSVEKVIIYLRQVDESVSARKKVSFVITYFTLGACAIVHAD